MPAVARRLTSGQDLYLAMQVLADECDIRAGVVLSGVGSLVNARIRNAGATKILQINGPLEIVSITGTLSKSGLHVHLSVADSDGRVTGGHLLEGCVVASTVELVLHIVHGLTFTRELDDQTGYKELVIS